MNKCAGNAYNIDFCRYVFYSIIKKINVFYSTNQTVRETYQSQHDLRPRSDTYNASIFLQSFLQVVKIVFF